MFSWCNLISKSNQNYLRLQRWSPERRAENISTSSSHQMAKLNCARRRKCVTLYPELFVTRDSEKLILSSRSHSSEPSKRLKCRANSVRFEMQFSGFMSHEIDECSVLLIRRLPSYPVRWESQKRFSSRLLTSSIVAGNSSWANVMATIVEPRLFSGQLCIYDVSLSSEKYSLPQMMSRRNKIPTTPTAHTWRMALPKLEFVSKQKNYLLLSTSRFMA